MKKKLTTEQTNLILISVILGMTFCLIGYTIYRLGQVGALNF